MTCLNIRINVLILCLFSGINLFAETKSNLDSLLNILDNVIENRDQYTKEKENKIQILRNQLNQTNSKKQQFQLTEQLFRQYNKYNVDSAFQIAKERLKIASELQDKDLIANAKMNMVEVLKTTGMYKEAEELLNEIKQKNFDIYNRAYYLHLRHSLYILMQVYSISVEDKTQYNTLVYNYKDSILQEIPFKGSIDYYLVTSTKHMMDGDYDKAQTTIMEAYEIAPENPMVCYTIAEIAKHQGRDDDQKRFLIESAIHDLRTSVREYLSLQQLAEILHSEGNIDQSYIYMKTSIEDAILSNARPRLLSIAKIWPLINETYDIQTAKESKELMKITVISVILMIFLLITLIYIYKQVRTLSTIRKRQKRMNTELKSMNAELSSVNSKLSDANLVKEEYINHLFEVYSSYIDKLEEFRVMVNRKIKTGQIEDLLKITSSNTLAANELKDFYKNFDTIFLRLYPNFVKDFNELLIKEEQIILKKDDLLTPELRIFALVRLGINDSTKIATFLHYSPQTIYNYRLKMRNKLAIPKEEFNDKLTKIGLTKL